MANPIIDDAISTSRATKARPLDGRVAIVTGSTGTAESDITCNAVCPGYVWTPLVEQQEAVQAASHGIPPEDVIRKALLAEQPNKRFATVAEIAGVVAFLCGRFAGSITGTTLTVDDGWTAH